MTRTTRLVFGFLALLGLAASVAAFFVHNAVLDSRFAVYHRVPVALGGVVYFTLVLLLALANGAPYLFLVSIPALSVALFLAYASFVVVKVFCGVCAVAFIATLGVFFVSASLPGEGFRELPRRAVRDVRALVASPRSLGIATLFLVASLASLFLLRRPAPDLAAAQAAVMAEQPSQFDIWFEEQTREPIAVATEGEAVLIMGFVDYQSAVSAEAYKLIGPVLARYQKEWPGRVRLLTKDYPLDPKCSPDIAPLLRETHPAACDAAVAVRLAQRQQRGAEMIEWLYSHQAELTPASVRRAAADVGGVTDFDSQYPQVLELIKNDVNFGRTLSVKAMPTFFINGVRIEGVPKLDILEKAIDHEIKVQRQTLTVTPSPGLPGVAPRP